MKTKKIYLAILDKINQSKLYSFAFIMVLSWIYALCAQLTIPLPFKLVPIYPHPLPIFACVFLFGWNGVYAYFAYLGQGIIGAPFFTAMRGGIGHLMGPTGGYLIGFALAAMFLMLTMSTGKRSLPSFLGKLLIANAIYYAFALSQLALFVPFNNLLQIGLYPFLIGDFFIKPAIMLFIMKAKRGF